MPENRLTPLDRELERLRSRHPGWHIWYVPKFPSGTAWCAQPLPHLTCYSPNELEADIAAADETVPKLSESAS